MLLVVVECCWWDALRSAGRAAVHAHSFACAGFVRGRFCCVQVGWPECVSACVIVCGVGLIGRAAVAYRREWVAQ